MEVDQALRALSQLKGAAPPTTSARLAEVITLVHALDRQAGELSAQIRQLDQEKDNLNFQLESVTRDATAVMLAQALETLRPSLLFVTEQAHSLREGRLGRLTTEQCDTLILMDDHAATALTLLETINEIASIQAGHYDLEPLLFSGLDLLAAAWQRCYRAAEQHEHQISVHADDPLPAVVGDYQHILTLLCDLLDNAIRYTPFGGVIRIMAESLGNQVLFSVADNGIGLSQEDHTRIGQPFWRALYQPLVRQSPGGGLRLYRAQQILAMHESQLFFSGEPGMGSTFSFTLPAG